MYGDPTFFDVSVVHTLKPSTSNDVSACTGVVAEIVEEW